MKLPLSKRLAACCRFIDNCRCVADIGCDHGYLGIYLLKNAITDSIIAADIHQQPLNTACHNAHKYGVADKMRFYLSDGAAQIPRDFDTMVCAGMGADTIISILSASPWLKSTQYTLILQCQSKAPALRRFLAEEGYCIEDEVVLRDGRFLYTVMKVRYHSGHTPAEAEYYFPTVMLSHPSEATAMYYRRVCSSLTRIINCRKEVDPWTLNVLTQVKALADDPANYWLLEVKHGNGK